jgi:hypothetical protein
VKVARGRAGGRQSMVNPHQNLPLR